MYIPIYFGDKPLFLCDSKQQLPDNRFLHTETLVIETPSLVTIQELLQKMEQPEISSCWVLGETLEQLFELFSHFFTTVIAAGGVVENEKREILLIFRRGKWDLPKGKLDEGESIEQCAIREVCEETGLQDVAIVEKLPDTFHTYEERGKKILKHSVWYKMTAKKNQSLLPQLEEDISDVKWVAKPDLSYYLNETYPSVRDVLNHLRSTLL